MGGRWGGGGGGKKDERTNGDKKVNRKQKPRNRQVREKKITEINSSESKQKKTK